jgi:hypothetical protein
MSFESLTQGLDLAGIRTSSAPPRTDDVTPPPSIGSPNDSPRIEELKNHFDRVYTTRTSSLDHGIASDRPESALWILESMSMARISARDATLTS